MKLALQTADDLEHEQAGSNLAIPDHGHHQAATAAGLAQKVFASMARRRRWLASLPVEEKYRRFLQLQRIACEIKRAAGRPTPAPWPDDGRVKR